MSFRKKWVGFKGPAYTKVLLPKYVGYLVSKFSVVPILYKISH